jgi:hypothetical protein
VRKSDTTTNADGVFFTKPFNKGDRVKHVYKPRQGTVETQPRDYGSTIDVRWDGSQLKMPSRVYRIEIEALS